MIYAIGDIQGCFEPFQCLLKQINFNCDRDQLWLAGDLVNRGPQSLDTLRYCVAHRDNIVAVQGNHDLHLLAIAFDPKRTPKRKDTLTPILVAPDRDVLLDWLLHNPLLHQSHEHQAVLVHAGIPPMWNLEEAGRHAQEVATVLQDEAKRLSFFQAMYGNKPAKWDPDLSGPTRWRLITNYFTRMRLCTNDHALDLSYKSTLENKPADLYAWFAAPNRKPIEYWILFGHWAALMGETAQDSIVGLDFGCVWGNQLKAYCIEEQTWFSCAC